MEVRNSRQEKFISGVVKKLWGLEPQKVKYLGCSVNETYRIICSNGTMALRKSLKTPYYSLDKAISEYELLKNLQDSLFSTIIRPVAPPIEEGGSIYFLTYWIEGNKFDGSSLELVRSAKYLANLHQNLERLNFKLESSYGDSYVDDMLSGKPSTHIDFSRYYPYEGKGICGSDIHFLENVRNNVSNPKVDWKTILGEKQIIHGDPREENFIFGSRKEPIMIDFQGARNDYPLSDLAWAISTGFCEMKSVGMDLDKTKLFLRNYTELRKARDLSLLPSLIRIRHLRSIETSLYFDFFAKAKRSELTLKREKGINFLKWLDSNEKGLLRIIDKLN